MDKCIDPRLASELVIEGEEPSRENELATGKHACECRCGCKIRFRTIGNAYCAACDAGCCGEDFGQGEPGQYDEPCSACGTMVHGDDLIPVSRREHHCRKCVAADKAARDADWAAQVAAEAKWNASPEGQAWAAKEAAREEAEEAEWAARNPDSDCF
jgi:hypothetical protein